MYKSIYNICTQVKHFNVYVLIHMYKRLSACIYIYVCMNKMHWLLIAATSRSLLSNWLFLFIFCIEIYETLLQRIPLQEIKDEKIWS